MDGEKLLGHVENLVPGFVTLAILLARVPPDTAFAANTAVAELLKQPFIAGVFLTAIAYLAGVVVFVISRGIVDTLSALLPRPLLLKAFRWRQFPGFHPVLINREYRAALDAALKRDAGDAIRMEVVRRRVRGRVIRTCLVPLALWLWPSQGAAALATALAGVVAVYAYAEVTIYLEARLAA